MLPLISTCAASSTRRSRVLARRDIGRGRATGLDASAASAAKQCPARQQHSYFGRLSRRFYVSIGHFPHASRGIFRWRGWSPPFTHHLAISSCWPVLVYSLIVTKSNNSAASLALRITMQRREAPSRCMPNYLGYREYIVIFRGATAFIMISVPRMPAYSPASSVIYCIISLIFCWPRALHWFPRRNGLRSLHIFADIYIISLNVKLLLRAGEMSLLLPCQSYHTALFNTFLIGYLHYFKFFLAHREHIIGFLHFMPPSLLLISFLYFAFEPKCFNSFYFPSTSFAAVSISLHRMPFSLLYLHY